MTIKREVSTKKMFSLKQPHKETHKVLNTVDSKEALKNEKLIQQTQILNTLIKELQAQKSQKQEVVKPYPLKKLRLFNNRKMVDSQMSSIDTSVKS
jgi:hypothetical protein